MINFDDDFKIKLIRMVAKEAKIDFPYSDEYLKQVPELLPNTMKIFCTGITTIVKMVNAVYSENLN